MLCQVCSIKCCYSPEIIKIMRDLHCSTDGAPLRPPPACSLSHFDSSEGEPFVVLARSLNPALWSQVVLPSTSLVKPFFHLVLESLQLCCSAVLVVLVQQLHAALIPFLNIWVWIWQCTKDPLREYAGNKSTESLGHADIMKKQVRHYILLAWSELWREVVSLEPLWPAVTPQWFVPHSSWHKQGSESLLLHEVLPTQVHVPPHTHPEIRCPRSLQCSKTHKLNGTHRVWSVQLWFARTLSTLPRC